jgi:hypothetical protein
MVARELGEAVRGLERTSGGLIKASVSTGGPPMGQQRELEERDDMTRVEFACHPDTPIKIVGDWIHDVHCFICGSAQPSPEPAAAD